MEWQPWSIISPLCVQLNSLQHNASFDDDDNYDDEADDDDDHH